MARHVVCTALLATAISVWAAPRQSPYVGNWVGRWTDQGNHQTGALLVQVAGDGSMTGIIANDTFPNRPLAAQWSGTVSRDGRMSAMYTYPGLSSMQARGTFQLDPESAPHWNSRMGFEWTGDRQG